MKLPSGVEVWQPMQETAAPPSEALRTFQATSGVSQVVLTWEGISTGLVWSSPTEKPDSVVMPTAPLFPPLVEPDGDQYTRFPCALTGAMVKLLGVPPEGVPPLAE